jgi:Spy/CpxP family protein refolding chaperone
MLLRQITRRTGNEPLTHCRGRSFRMKKLLIWVVLPALTLALLGEVWSVSAQARGERHQRGLPPIERLAEKLELSAEQVAQIKALREEGEAERIELKKQLMQLRNEFEGEMLKPELNERSLKSLTQQMGEVRTKMHLLRLESRLAMREVLTDEQWDKLLTSRKGPGQGHRGRGPRGRGLGSPEAGNWRER